MCKIEKAFFFFGKIDRNYASTDADALTTGTVRESILHAMEIVHSVCHYVSNKIPNKKR